MLLKRVGLIINYKYLFSIIGLFFICAFSSVLSPVQVNAASTNIGIQYRAYVQNTGWQNWVSDGSTAGTTFKGLRMEAFQVRLTNPTPGMSVQYRAYVQNTGWQGWVSDGGVAGTTYRSLRIEAVQIRLINPPSGIAVQYRTRMPIGWRGWTTEGYSSGVIGLGIRIEAIQIQIIKFSVTQIVSMSTISGESRVGNVLRAGTLSPANATANYQWQRSDSYGGIYTNIPNAMSNTYTTTIADIGKNLRVVATGNGLFAGSVTSYPTVTITAIPITGISPIVGSAKAGQVISAGTLNRSDATANYQWQISDSQDGIYSDIVDANSNTYTLIEQDLEKYIRVIVTGTGKYEGNIINEPVWIMDWEARYGRTGPCLDGDGSGMCVGGFIGGLMSPITECSGYALLSGGGITQYKLRTTYDGLVGSCAFSYYAQIEGEYYLYLSVTTGADVIEKTKLIWVGSYVAEDVLNILTVGPITGDTQIGSELSAGEILPIDATVSYQWQESDEHNGIFSNIEGATLDKYTLVEKDLNKYIRVIVTGTGYYSSSAISDSTPQITEPIVQDWGPRGGSTEGCSEYRGGHYCGIVIGNTFTMKLSNFTVPIIDCIGSYAFEVGGDDTHYPVISSIYTDQYSGGQSCSYSFTSTRIGSFQIVPYATTSANAIEKSKEFSSWFGGSSILRFGYPITINEPTLTISKPYDGNTDAAISTNGFYGLIDNDEVYLSVSAKYENPNVGNNKSIDVKYVLSGKDAYKYVMTNPYLWVSNGEITDSPMAWIVANISINNNQDIIGTTLQSTGLMPSMANVFYQWQNSDSKDGVYTDINGATSNTYTLTNDDFGKFIRVVASGTGSYTGNAISEPFGPIYEWGQNGGGGGQCSQFNQYCTMGGMSYTVPISSIIAYALKEGDDITQYPINASITTYQTANDSMEFTFTAPSDGRYRLVFIVTTSADVREKTRIFENPWYYTFPMPL